jgi:hypothetical protein
MVWDHILPYACFSLLYRTDVDLFFSDPYELYRTDWSPPKKADVVTSFYPPEHIDPSGLAWDGKYLWVAYDNSPYSKIYRYDVSGDAAASPKHTPAMEGILPGFSQLSNKKTLRIKK